MTFKGSHDHFFKDLLIFVSIIVDKNVNIDEATLNNKLKYFVNIESQSQTAFK